MDYYFLDSFFARQYAQEEWYGQVFLVAAGFAVCLGLFGLTYYTVVRKQKEIGIRKVIGATVMDLFGMLSRSYVALLVLAFAIATPLTYFLLEQWLRRYAFRTELGIGIFVWPFLLLAPLVLLTVGSLTVKAARVNPTESLRSE
ncbi:putative ABC transport system permease protein [Catalinimonas alkaloidigena]|uniref:Putative ABC transport system permease protein n=1 Tax=Catalinimonas alkaloidigena TaxID=1075417 RepID=A0A1G9KNJ7_9BACT|nr:FtsX-like permease family protein [Catalinimonas alkaloidigena]SDL51281.1 putative ABC transport system permease protein [Catalinimonas alkaloidigena]